MTKRIAPGGGGKVPINPGYILYHDNEKIVIRNYEGKILMIRVNVSRPPRSGIAISATSRF
jgi:hypothetical protein